MSKRLSDMSESDLRTYMNMLAQATEPILPTKALFLLLVFEQDQPGLGQYVSNANRSDMIKVMRETADRLEKREDRSR